MIHRYRRSMLAAVATSMFVGLAGLSGGSFLTESASAVDPPAVYDNFNGTGNADGSATEAGGKTWQALNGTWTRSGSGTVTTDAGPGANPMLVTDVGSADVDARTSTTGTSGEAVYLRVQDANNWLRARIRHSQTPSTYYPTEYQHQDYFTERGYSYTYREYKVSYYTVEYQYQDRWYQRQYSTTTYGAWSGWSTYAQSACQSSAGEVSLPGDTDTAQYRTANAATAGCTGGKKKWDKQSRSRTVTVSSVWVTDGTSPPSGYAATGSTRYLSNGSPYWGTPHPSTGLNTPTQVSSRNVFDHGEWTSDPPAASPTVVISDQRITDSGLQWWTRLNSLSSTDPCSYAVARNKPPVLSCSATGATRQGDPVGDPYWDANPCPGCPTRAAATPVTVYTDTYELRLEKSVAGTVTNLGSWGVANTSGFRVTAEGSTISVFAGPGEGSLAGTVVEPALAYETKHGCGLGGDDSTNPTNAITYCYLRVLVPATQACVDQYSSSDRTLHEGQVRKDEAGVTAVGGSGLESLEVTVSPEGERQLEISMADDADPESMAVSYAAQGRSILEDAQAAGVGIGLIRQLCEEALADGPARRVMSGGGAIFDSMCAHDTKDYVDWDACVTRFRATDDEDPAYNYGIDDAQAYGHETSRWPWNDLHVGGVTNKYSTSYVDITSASPGSDISDVDRCYETSFGASVGGFGIESGGTVCPDRWDITRSTAAAVPEYHKVEWEGSTNDDREARAVTAYRVRQGHSSTYDLYINYDVG